MSRWEGFFVDEAPEGAELHEIPIWLAAKGALRLQSIARHLGGIPQAIALAKSLGKYELDEKLVMRLRLEGLQLSDGEISALSPERWLDAFPLKAKPLTSVAADWEEKGMELIGIRLEPAERRLFLGFTRALCPPEPLGPWEMAAVYEHYSFPKRRTMNLIAATRARV